MPDDPDDASRYGGDLKATVCWRDPGSAIGPGILAYSQFCSLRSGRRFCTRRKHERAVLLVVDTMPEVLEARLRPAVVSYWHLGIERQAEPLLWVRREQVDEFWFDAAVPELDDRAYEGLVDQLCRLRIGSRRVDVDALTAPGRLEIARLLRRHARHPLGPLAMEHARRVLADAPVLLQEVLQGRHPTLTASTACRLVFDGGARLRPADRVRPETRVELIHH